MEKEAENAPKSSFERPQWRRREEHQSVEQPSLNSTGRPVCPLACDLVVIWDLVSWMYAEGGDTS